MGIIRDMQRAHATQTAAEQRSHTAAAQQRDLIRRNADLAIAAAQQAASDVERQRERRRLYVEARTADAAAANADLRARLADLDATAAVHTGRRRPHRSRPVQEAGGGAAVRPGPARPAAARAVAGTASRRPGRAGSARSSAVSGCTSSRWPPRGRPTRRPARAGWRPRRGGCGSWRARERAYEESRRKYEARIAAYNAEVDRFAAAVAGADPSSVVEYFAMVLGNSVYPDDFPQHFRLAYLPEAASPTGRVPPAAGRGDPGREGVPLRPGPRRHGRRAPRHGEIRRRYT